MRSLLLVILTSSLGITSYCQRIQHYLVNVKSNPVGIYVTTLDNEYKGITPCSFKMSNDAGMPRTIPLFLYKDFSIDTTIFYVERLTGGFFSDIDLNITLIDADLKTSGIYPPNRKLSIGNIVVDVRQGEVVGLSETTSDKIFYNDPDYASSKDFKTIAEQECDKAGIKMVGKLNLFEEESDNAEYMLGGIVKKILFHYKLKSLATIYKGCMLTVEWQLYDRVKKEVVLTKSINAVATNVHEDNLTALIFETYKNSLKKLLSDNDFYMKFADQSTPSANNPLEILIANTAKQNYKEVYSPSLLQNSVVTIKPGIGRHGSGFLISTDGYILTNNHVIEKADTIEVILNSGLTLPGEIIYNNADADLAILKVIGTGFKPINIGNSDSVSIGEELIAIGTPVSIDLGQSVTKGVLSGSREIEGKKYLQADVSVSPGNSGGPLINTKGQVIGIITSKKIGKGVEGISFAIPINDALKVLNIKLPIN